jgi:hypothetical protein
MRLSIWLALALGIVTVVGLVRVRKTTLRAANPDVGSVSDHWVAEHRGSLDDTH